jgi:hypothetical protein
MNDRSVTSRILKKIILEKEEATVKKEKKKKAFIVFYYYFKFSFEFSLKSGGERETSPTERKKKDNFPMENVLD